MTENVLYDESIWRYFIKEAWPFAICNICYSSCIRQYISRLESHLLFCHRHAILEMKEEIKHSELSKYFTFNVQYDTKTTCIICDVEMKLSYGIRHLRHYLSTCHKMNLEDNAKEQYTDADDQYVVQDSLLWRYFTQEVKCSICGERFNVQRMSNLENHIISMPQIIEELRKKIRYSEMSQSLTFNVAYDIWTSCIICNKTFNLFDEMLNRKYHVLTCHPTF